MATSPLLDLGRAAQPAPVADVAARLGFAPDEIEPHGLDVVKIRLSALNRMESRPDGRLVLVTAITPTPLGEGKTTTTIGLAQGLARIGLRAAITIRQPSLGPIFGVKGGGSGGGRSQVLPSETMNLHLTGDGHAVGAAHNLASAFLDNHLHHKNRLGIDPTTITWPRVVDMNDRALRRVQISTAPEEGDSPRFDEFQITAASEVMAILALTTGYSDLRARLARVVVARTTTGAPVTLADLRASGPMAVLLRDAIKPNLLQSTEGVPAFVHAGPFANIAHGNSSVLGDRMALKVADWVCTEAGFASEMGAEKFFDIKCRQSGLRAAAVVVVATVRALKMHGGAGRISGGRRIDPGLLTENVAAVRAGCANLARHIANVRAFGVPCVVAVNAFPEDTPAEFAVIRDAALAAGAHSAHASTHFADGGRGAEALARGVVAATADPPRFTLLYPDDAPLAEKITAIATRLYGADGVDFSPAAVDALAALEASGAGRLPVCMAKTPASLSHDPSRLNSPTGFRLPVRTARLAAGAGFVTVLCGDIRTMPGLPTVPAGEGMDLDDEGNVVGLQ